MLLAVKVLHKAAARPEADLMRQTRLSPPSHGARARLSSDFSGSKTVSPALHEANIARFEGLTLALARLCYTLK